MPSQQEAAQQNVTTLLFKNVPRSYDNKTLLHEIQIAAGVGLIDFLLLPWDGATRNMGYAFVNCVDVDAVARLRAGLAGKHWPNCDCAKPVKIMDAKVAARPGARAGGP